MSGCHRPVLLMEALHALAIEPTAYYVDATYGRGGHALGLLHQLNSNGRLLALDRDPAAVADAQQRFAGDRRFCSVQAPFSRLAEVVRAHFGETGVQGVLLDLGVSSPQLDDAERGFSFHRDGPLDMRMDPNSGLSAADWLYSVSEAELAAVLRKYGEERFAKRIARAIVQARLQAPILRTGQLAAIISAAVPSREPGLHPATRSFQAIRIVINGELDELAAVLEQARQVLTVGGRLVVISFHSLEDRLVKRFFRRHAQADDLPPDLPVPAALSQATLRSVGKPTRASAAEVALNPRARSAIMRVAERVSEGAA